VLAVGAYHYSAVRVRFATLMLFLCPCQIRYLELKAQERDVGSHPTKLKDSEGTVDLYAAHPVGVYPECGNTSPNAVLMLKKAKLWNRQDFTALLQHRGAYTVTSLSKLRRVKRVLDNLCSLIVGVRCVVCNRLQLRMLTVLPFYYRSTCRTGWLGSCCAQGVCRVADKW
jgi:hypothetical protein